ncbi:sulfite exporter TauE/SafE family protein [Allokutzneria multivorans]|uniref:Probable membrane transporter protein n=1 Tax=Allokutzneria multivorans TaxID=1142134 RepID=A0ABP7SWP3_9PSEU
MRAYRSPVFTTLDLPGFAGVSVAALAFLCAAAFLAGAIDAIVGGGGLVQLPAMLLVMPGGAPIHSLATSKLSSFVGTAAAVGTYVRRTKIDWRSTAPTAVLAFGGSVGGAAFADVLPPGVLNVVVLCALVGVGLYTWRKPEFGAEDAERLSRARTLMVMLGGGVVIGFWDGLAGPGTGSFLVFLLVGLVGFAFVRASATAKVINTATNLGGLCYFVPAGQVLWGIGLTMALCNLAGSVLGARMAVRRGSEFVRKVFLTVVAALVLSLGWKVVLGT